MKLRGSIQQFFSFQELPFPAQAPVDPPLEDLLAGAGEAGGITDGGIAVAETLLDGFQVLPDKVGCFGKRLSDLGGREFAHSIAHRFLPGPVLARFKVRELGADQEIVQDGAVFVVGRFLAFEQERFRRIIECFRPAQGANSEHQPTQQGLGLPFRKGGHAHIEAVPEITLLPDIGILRSVDGTDLAAHDAKVETLRQVELRHVIAEALVEGREHHVAFVDQGCELG